MSLDPERRAGLLGAKLRSLVASTGHVADQDSVIAAGGAALVDGDRCWLLADDESPADALGRGILLAAGRGCSELHVWFDDADAAAVAARRAGFLEPPPRIRAVVGRTLEIVESAPPDVSPEAPPAPDGFDDLCRGVGVEPIVEHGVWRGEVLGLEVMRATDDGIEVGVGRFDREASAVMHGDRPPAEALAAAADQVRAQRRPGAGAHPLATLARERWLRRDLVADPSSVGLVDLVPVDPADERLNLRDPAPAPALGRDADGASVLVVCSVGVDPGLVPAVADLVGNHRPERVVIVVPTRDVLAPVERAVARLAVPATIVGVDGGWG